MNRFVCIHGHFYQPPRENPWLDEVELQDSAHPYHDWNERITVECYGRNAYARILDGNRKISDITNNYSRISFNFGATLLSWMERKSPEVYAAILEADRLSQKNFSGHGSAIAQVYNHMIMPLANTRDKRTQVIWGIQDFERRFKRAPEGMWLAETAVDLETLDIMVEHGIKFTILAPNQAKRVKDGAQEMLWRDVNASSVDPRVPYRCYLPSGKSIAIFFYDGPVAQGVAFEGLLNNGEHFARRLEREFNANTSQSQLVHIATDGETYGHHHKFGDMALAYCLQYLEENQLAKLTVYGEYLEKFPITHEVEINENSSWSCAHGIERWRSDCGCSTGGGSGWNQAWRAPLRNALDWLRDEMAILFEHQMLEFSNDPWAARDAYIDVIAHRDPKDVDSFIKKYINRELSSDEKIKVLKLFEMQYNALLMYTSCGWFFNDISGLETVQILQYAARAIQLTKDITGKDLEDGFLNILEKAVSNVPEFVNGAQVYRQMVKPSVVDLLRVGAHYAVTSLFEHYPVRIQMYAYKVERDKYVLKEAGRLKMTVGSAHVSSSITFEKVDIQFAVLHLGDHNFIGGVDYLKPEDFAIMQNRIMTAFTESNISEIISLINRYFGPHNYSLWHLFKQEQHTILNQVLSSTMGDVESSFRQIYEHHYPLMQIKNELRLPLPRTLVNVVEFILNRDLSVLLEDDDFNIDRLRSLVEEMKRWSFKRDQENFSFLASASVSRMMLRLKASSEDVALIDKITLSLELLEQLNLDLDLWKAENIYFVMKQTAYPKALALADSDLLVRNWVTAFERLGAVLQVNTTNTSALANR